MNDSDGTTTSSPGPTRRTTSARCRAAVQEETATAWPAPSAAANACSNSATRGPCATQPGGRPRPRPRPLPRAEPGPHHRDGHAAPTPASAAAARHQETSRSRPSSRSTSARQPSRFRGARDVGQAPGHRVDAARRAVLQGQIAAHDAASASARARSGWSRFRCRC